MSSLSGRFPDEGLQRELCGLLLPLSIMVYSQTRLKTGRGDHVCHVRHRLDVTRQHIPIFLQCLYEVVDLAAMHQRPTKTALVGASSRAGLAIYTLARFLETSFVLPSCVLVSVAVIPRIAVMIV